MKIMQIKARIGCCNLDLELLPIEAAANKRDAICARGLIFHNAASAVYGSGDGKFNRDAPYSDKLSEACIAAATKKLQDFFEVKSVKTSPYVKLSDFEKFAKEMRKIGFSDENQIKVIWDSKPKTEEKIESEETAEENSEEIIG